MHAIPHITNKHILTGTGIALYGLSNCSYDVTFDGTLEPDTTLSQGVFFSKVDVEAGSHNVSLSAKPDSDDQILSFKGAIVTSAAKTTYALFPIIKMH